MRRRGEEDSIYICGGIRLYVHQYGNVGVVRVVRVMRVVKGVDVFWDVFWG